MLFLMQCYHIDHFQVEIIQSRFNMAHLTLTTTPKIYGNGFIQPKQGRFAVQTCTFTHSFTSKPRSSKPIAHQRQSHIPCAVSQDAPATSDLTMSQAISIVHTAASDSSVPPKQVFQAMRTLEKEKLPTDGWNTILGGTSSPGNRWRLVFTTGTKEVAAALRNSGAGGGGKYFPITAVQKWDASKNEIENGIFLGHLIALTFRGPYKFTGKKLQFDFDTIAIKLGPKFEFPLKAKINPASYVPDPKGPFFIFVYVDEKVCVARGRGGGIAMWARTTPSEELKIGVL